MSDQPGFFAYYVIDIAADRIASVEASLDAATEALPPGISALVEELALSDISIYARESETGLASTRLWL